MSVRTSVRQVQMVGGSQSDRPSGILVEERASYLARGRKRGNLYVLVEISGLTAGRDIVARQLLEAVRETYYAWQGSITAGLQQAIRAVSSWLFEENRNSLPHDQRTAGVSCAVLRDDDLFIAQAGPAAVFLAQAGQVTRFPDVSPWLDELPLEDADAAPLGARRDLNVALFHTQINEGDVLLMVESTVARRLSPAAWTGIMARPSSEAILGSLATAVGGTDMSAVVVKMEEEAAEVALPTAGQPAAVLGTGRVVPPPATRDMLPSYGAPRQSLQEKLAAWEGRYPVRDWIRKAVQVILGALAAVWTALLALLRRMLPERLSPTTPPATRAGEARGPLRQPPRAGGVQARKRPVQEAQAEPRSEPRRRALVALAIAIPLIVLFIVLAAVLRHAQSQRADRAQVEQWWQQANESWEQAQQAQTAGNKEAERTYLNEAKARLDDVLESQPTRADAQELLKKVQDLQDQVNLVQRIVWTGKLRSYPAGARLSRVIVEDTHVFVMDRNAGKVYHHRLDASLQALQPETADAVLVRKGDLVGDVLVEDLVDMVWVSAGNGRQRAALVILESGGKLLEYDPGTGQLSAPKISAAVTFTNPKFVGTWNGTFYVLDATANKIWRYLPTADGYADPPEDRLSQVANLNLNGVLDMAIADSIYLLDADGTIRRFTEGKADTYDIADWDEPPKGPDAIFTRPPEEWQSVYVADQGNSRIVQTDFDGHLKRQLRIMDESAAAGGNSLSGVTSLFVNEINGQAFYLSGNELYLAILPALSTR